MTRNIQEKSTLVLGGTGKTGRRVVERLNARGVPTRVYVPYGPAWYRYWMRRVAESRGA